MKAGIFVFLLLCTTHLWAVQLRGVIYDENHEAIPFASVTVDQTNYGVSANVLGEYVIELSKGNQTLIFEALGFEKKIITIELQANTTRNVSLIPKSYELETVDIDVGEDPAYPLIRQAIAAKKDFKNNCESFICDNYIKSSLEEVYKDSLLQPTDSKLNFTESYGQVKYLAPNQYKEIIQFYNNLSNEKSNPVAVSVSMGNSYENSKWTPVDPDLFYTHYMDADFNFLDNQVFEEKITSMPVTSPISDFAFMTYRYRFIETIYSDSSTVHKIQIYPKNKGGAAFEGLIFIDGTNFSLKRVELTINPQVLKYYSSFKLVQEYAFFDRSFWLPVRREYHYAISGGNKSRVGKSIAYHSNYQINVPINKKEFKNEIYTTEDGAYDLSLAQWDSIRPVQLKDEEKAYISLQDSLEQVRNDPARLDSIYAQKSKTTLENIFLSGLEFRTKDRKTVYSINPLLFSDNLFGVGGFRQELGVNRRQEFNNAHELTTNGKVSFGFNNSDFRGSLNTAYMYAPKKFATGKVNLGDIYDVITYQTDLSNIFARSNFVNKRFIGIGHEYEVVNGLFLDLASEYVQVNSIEQLEIEEWSSKLFPNNTPQAFDDYAELFLDVNLLIRFKQKYYTLPKKKVIIGSKYPTLDVHYKKGIPSLGGSVVDFDYLELKVRQDLQLGKLGNSNYRVKAGQFLRKKDIRIIDYKYFRGSDVYFFSDPLNTFQMLANTKKETNTFFEGHYIHHFNGFFTNSIPGVRKLKIHTLAGAGALVTANNSFKHVEAFAGFEKSFRIRKQLYKFIVVGSTSISNDGFDYRIKFGLDLFNFVTNSWSY